MPLTPVSSGGRPRELDLRDIADAGFSVLRIGCQRRSSPKDFPRRKHHLTVLRLGAVRWHPRPDWWPAPTQGWRRGEPFIPWTSPSADGQSVGTTSGTETQGRDNHKKVVRRRRDIVVDIMGLAVAVLATAASIDEGLAARKLFAGPKGS